MGKSYQHYTAADFLEDPSFVQWMEGNEDASRFWKEWTKENPEKAEEVRKAQMIYLSLRGEEQEVPVSDRNALWEKISGEAFEEEYSLDPSVASPFPWRRILAYAAMLALLVFATIYFWPGQQLSYVTQAAEIQRHTLPDQSMVILNAASSLEYDASDSIRSLQLSGEAFFEVKEGKPFLVQSAGGLVTVLGTSFNIYDRGQEYEVICSGGKVQVDVKEGGKYILTAGEYVRLNKDGTISTNDGESPVNTEAWIAWTEGEFFFPDANLQKVMNELERQFDVTVHMDDDLADIQGAFYFTNEDLSEALENILWPLRLEFSKEGKQIYIRKQ